MKKDILKKKWKKNLVIGCIVVFFTYIAVNTISILRFSCYDQKREAEVAIVLGAATHDGKVSPVYQERLNHGICLYKDGYVKKLIVTGGVGEGNELSDAYVAKEYAISQGIPKKDILTEDTSTITQENLENSKVILDENGYENAIVVSDPLHMKRAMLLAKDAGITAYSSPTPTTKYVSLKTKIPFLAREVFFYIGYKWCRIFM